jgi:hypothetical protein
MPRGSGRVGAADVRRVRRLLVADQPVSGDDLDLAEALVHRSRRFAERLWLWVLFELFWIWILIRDVLNWHGGGPLRWLSVAVAGVAIAGWPWLAWRAYRVRQWGGRHLS